MTSHRASEGYLHGHDEAVLRSHRARTAKNSCGYLLGSLARDAKILDVGCGPGTITVDLGSWVPDGSVTGIDNEAAVIEIARGYAASLGCNNVSFEYGNVGSLHFESASFDVVHAHQVLQHLSDPVTALIEMRRVCRKGGIVAARDADYGGMFWSPNLALLERWQKLYRSVARTAGGEPDAGRHLRSWALAAGFSKVEATASAWYFATEDERAWWGGLWAERLTGTRFGEQAVLAGLATKRELQELAEAWREWAACTNSCFVVPHVEVLCTP